jgi:hypothetical protein
MDSYEEIFLSLKALSERVPVSVRTLRAWLKDEDDPMPHYKKHGRVCVWWPEFVAWYRGEDIVNEKVEELTAKFRETGAHGAL